jgi:uncharacterized protein (TIGR02679 family)
VDREKLAKTLGHPDLRWLLRSLRKRRERGGSCQSRLTLPELTTAEREALHRLLGKRLAWDARSISLAELERLLADGGVAGSLQEAVELLTGPCIRKSQERQRAAGKWKEIFSEARALARPELQGWLEGLERSGLLRRQSGSDLEEGKKLLEKALEIATTLPAQGMALTELAAIYAGSSHALDPGTALGLLVLRAAAAIGGFQGAMEGAESRRAAWESAGIFCDELSATVLVLNLRAETRSLCGATLASHADHGEPCRLTLRQLLRHPLEFGDRYSGKPVYICENPAVVAAAAERLGRQAAPLLCVEGNPRTPAARLLRQLRDSGAQLHYHGDFDWDGIRIANLVMKRFGALPWRFRAEDYLRNSSSGIPLEGRPSLADWDPTLARRMREAGRALHEEAVLEALCGDLGS